MKLTPEEIAEIRERWDSANLIPRALWGAGTDIADLFAHIGAVSGERDDACDERDAAQRERDNVETLNESLVRELDRWKTGQLVEGDYVRDNGEVVADPYVRAEKAEAAYAAYQGVIDVALATAQESLRDRVQSGLSEADEATARGERAEADRDKWEAVAVRERGARSDENELIVRMREALRSIADNKHADHCARSGGMVSTACPACIASRALSHE